MALDLGSFASIRSFSEQLHERSDRLDGLLNNAGTMFTPYGTTEDELEQQTGVNHFEHFLLTGLLLDRLLATEGSRVVNLSSSSHRMGHPVQVGCSGKGRRRQAPVGGLRA
ncbi:MAG: SDR family NAD(P)-dependent oxidoreductase, partial [Proteobacteria bacterium]|nr:SDR family NAD(P)-dependent oxidoreductase [Pseudomonadota bacterium]